MICEYCKKEIDGTSVELGKTRKGKSLCVYCSERHAGIIEYAPPDDYVYDVIEMKSDVYYINPELISDSIHSLGMVGARTHQEAFNKAVHSFCKRGIFAHPKPTDILVVLRCQVDGKPRDTPLTVRELKEYQSGLMGIGVDEIIKKEQSTL